MLYQAEDGIRDKLVTGVQTCALPIYVDHARAGRDLRRSGRSRSRIGIAARSRQGRAGTRRGGRAHTRRVQEVQIGRASCRGRVEISVVGGSFKKKKQAGHVSREDSAT